MTMGDEMFSISSRHLKLESELSERELHKVPNVLNHVYETFQR